MSSDRRLIAILLSSSLIALPGTTLAQAEPSIAPAGPEAALIERLCAANAVEGAERDGCVAAIEAVLAGDAGVADVGERISAIVDDAIASAEGLDVEAALEDLRASIDEFDFDMDIGALVDEATASIDQFDANAFIDGLEAELDELAGEVGEVDLVASIEEGIERTRNVIASARSWIEENPELVCDAGSVSVGSGAAAVVGFLTESPGLALLAYRETQKATEGACSSVIE